MNNILENKRFYGRNWKNKRMKKSEFSNKLKKYVLEYIKSGTFDITNLREVDSGSGRTLAACLTHASRAEQIDGILRGEKDLFRHCNQDARHR